MAINVGDILINGAAYDWASLTVTFNINGIPTGDQIIYGVTKVDYSNEMPIVNNFGKGRLPVSYGRQNITAKASMTINTGSLNKLRNAAPDNVIQDLPKFDVQCSYITASGETRVDIIKDCHIDKDAMTLSQNDPESKIDIELNPSYIIFGQASK